MSKTKGRKEKGEMMQFYCNLKKIEWKNGILIIIKYKNKLVKLKNKYTTTYEVYNTQCISLVIT